MENESTKTKNYYIKRTHKFNGDIVHIGPSDLSTMEKRLKDYQSRENDEYEYILLEFVYMPIS